MGLDKVRHHSQSRQDEVGPEVRAMEWVKERALRVELKDTLPGTVHSAREAKVSRPIKLKVEQHLNHLRNSSSKLQPERSMNHGFSSSVSRQRSQLI